MTFDDEFSRETIDVEAGRVFEESPQALTALIRTFLKDSFVKWTVAQGSSRT
jgi:hypothetical protein